jgi:choline dehydrogenase-like flavoprotein
MGTCRIGRGNGAVVDLNLTVRGLAGLRVIDASVMPKMVSDNIQAAVMMLATKGADFVLSTERYESVGICSPEQAKRIPGLSLSSINEFVIVEYLPRLGKGER